MGKVITEGQMALLDSLSPTRIYAALDDDAISESEKLFQRYGDKLYVLQVPKSAQERCRLKGSKADFGECTYEECAEAVKNAFQMTERYLF